MDAAFHLQHSFIKSVCSPCKVIRILESRKHFLVVSGIQESLLVESGILIFGIGNPGPEIQNPSKNRILGIRNPGPEIWNPSKNRILGIRNPGPKIQNPSKNRILGIRELASISWNPESNTLMDQISDAAYYKKQLRKFQLMIFRISNGETKNILTQRVVLCSINRPIWFPLPRKVNRESTFGHFIVFTS